MELIPAIDLLGGKVVRLHRGDYEAATAYASDPVAQARAFAEAGAERVHVVDLEGARSGAPAHAAVVEAILGSVPIAVQVGGGIRTREAAARWLSAGAERVVLGTVAARDPELARALCAEHPGRVVIAIDARG
ncbi:MAG TPA: HisA/HisF-related TIM barrel protein, partial [Sandaracinaceae bacterium]